MVLHVLDTSERKRLLPKGPKVSAASFEGQSQQRGHLLVSLSAGIAISVKPQRWKHPVQPHLESCDSCRAEERGKWPREGRQEHRVSHGYSRDIDVGLGLQDSVWEKRDTSREVLGP